MRRLVLAAIAIIGAAIIVLQAAAAPVNITDPLDPQGRLKTAEQLPASNMKLLAPSFFSARFIYGADGNLAADASTIGWNSPKCVTADSTVLLQPTLGYNRLALFFTVTFEDSVGAALFAIQWRGTGNSSASDSTNTFVMLGESRNIIRPQVLLATTATASATMHAPAIIPGYFAGVPLGAQVMCAGLAQPMYVAAKPAGDSTLTLSANATVGVNSALVQFSSSSSPYAVSDTIGSFVGGAMARLGTSALAPWGGSGPDTSTLYQGERALVLMNTINGNNVIVPVKTGDGQWFTPPNFGMRMRIMNTYFYGGVAADRQLIAIGNAGKSYGARLTVGAGSGMCETCGGKGSAATSEVGKFVIVRGDLYGWRE